MLGLHLILDRLEFRQKKIMPSPDVSQQQQANTATVMAGVKPVAAIAEANLHRTIGALTPRLRMLHQYCLQSYSSLVKSILPTPRNKDCKSTVNCVHRTDRNHDFLSRLQTFLALGDSSFSSRWVATVFYTAFNLIA